MDNEIRTDNCLNDNTIEPSAASLIIDALKAEQVKHVFGIPGSHVLDIFNMLHSENGIKLIPVTHENNGAYMAGMYGFLSGKPGVTIFTAGPGATNSVTGVAQAYASSFPMIHITGDIPLNAGNEAFHGVDKSDFLYQMFKNITKWSVRIERAEQIPEIFSKAFSIARSGRPGPVHIDIPIDISAIKKVKTQPYILSKNTIHEPSEKLLQKVYDLFIKAQRPMICAGQGIISDNAEHELMELVEYTSSPVLCGSYASGAISQLHPLSVGYFSEYSGNTFGFELLQESDFLLIIGLRSNSPTLHSILKYAPKKNVFIAFDELDTLKVSPEIEDTHICNTKLFLEKLLQRIKTHRFTENLPLKKRIKSVKEAFDCGLEKLIGQYISNTPLHFGVILKELSTIIDSDSIVFSGVGNHHIWGRNIFLEKTQIRFIHEDSWGTMGSELPAGIASKLVFPEKQTVIITGDGSLLMSCSEILTSVEMNLPILIVVLNDSCYGMINIMQNIYYKKTIGDQLGNTNFALLSESFGAIGYRIKTYIEFKKIIKEAVSLSKKQTVLLDIVCDYNFPWPNRDAIIRSAYI